MSNTRDLAHWLRREGANCQKHIDCADAIERLTADLADVTSMYNRCVDDVHAARSERNEYQIAADKQAMEHKIERDALSVQVDALAKDAAALVQRGRDAMREEAVKVCDESEYPDGWDLARLIEAIK